MKKMLLGALLFTPLLFGKRYTVDKTVALIYHREGEALILQSDLTKGVEAETKTVDDLVFEKLMLFDAQTLKIETDEEACDRALKQVQKTHDLSEDDVKGLFKTMGLSWQEGLKMLSDRQIIENIIDYRVKPEVKVDEEDAIEYHAAHPVTTYTVSFAWIPYGNRSKTLLKLTLEKQVASGNLDTTINWSNPIDVKGDTIANDKQFITNLSPGDIAISAEEDDGIQLVRLVSRKEQELDDQRKREIMSRLAQERFIKAMKNYYATLLKSAVVKYL